MIQNIKIDKKHERDITDKTHKKWASNYVYDADFLVLMIADKSNLLDCVNFLVEQKIEFTIDSFSNSL